MKAAEMTTLRILVNDRWVEPKTPFGSPALDFIRGELGLTGTKEGCREGDCGACAVLVGEFAGGSGSTGSEPMGSVGAAPRYLAVPSCLLALGDLAGKHLITIEGLGAGSGTGSGAGAPDGLTPVMRAFLEENATQCGFCTPGFIISLSAWLAAPGAPDLAGAMAAVDGNLCRCTGYGSIRRAAERLAREFADLPEEEGLRLSVLVERGVLPRSVLAFIESGGREAARGTAAAGVGTKTGRMPITAPRGSVALGGGTDYYVRNPDPGEGFRPSLLRLTAGFSGIVPTRTDDSLWVRIGAASTISDFFASPLVRRAVPGIEAFQSLFASTLIRNLATVGGNIANASPVGDITSMLMGLGAKLEIGAWKGSGPGSRYIAIEDFFAGYKETTLRGGEIVAAILIPDAGALQDSTAEQAGATRPDLFFSFEKIAKREKLDIAAVNTAISFRVSGGRAQKARISAGGVAAVPLLLAGAAARLEGASVDRKDPRALAELARVVASAAEEEVSPIDDVRGSAAYRKRMTGRLVLAHFVRLFGGDGIAKELFP